MKKIVTCWVLCLQFFLLNAQKVIYSEPDRDDTRQTDFDIIGKVGGNILIYKTLRSNYTMSVYDMNLKEKDKVKLDFLPERIINADFLAYPDFCYMFYQYQKKNILYAMAAKIDGNGKLIGKEMLMDTTVIGFLASNKIYSVVNSDNKEYIDLLKINSKDEERFLVTTMLFTKELAQKEKTRLTINMPDRHDFLTGFMVDNDGDFAFLRAVQDGEHDKLQHLFLHTKMPGATNTEVYAIDLKKTWLEDVRLKSDNYNRHYIISSFYSNTKRGNVDGMYTCVWDKATTTTSSVVSVVFSEQLRNEARGDNGTKTAFNDYFIRNIIVRKDGGFILAAESFFSSSRGGTNRYDYMYGSPFLQPADFYSFGTLGLGYPWYRYNNLGQNIRYNAQNITVFSFDSSGKINWTNVITKNQYDDETDAYIGYSLLNTGDQLHFLFNQLERRLQLLSAQSISPEGKVTRNPTLKNLDKGYDFMAHYGKQIGQRQIIFPCMYRNYLCFAKLDF